MGAMQQNRVRASIRRFPLFSQLEDEQLDFLCEGAHMSEASRGEILCDSRTGPAGFYGVVEGKLKLALLSRCGREHVFDILLPGMSFGEYTIRGCVPCPLYAEALIKSEVLCLNKEQILAAMQRWQRLSLCMVDSLTDHLHRLLHNLETCCLQSATQRVAHYLLCQVQTGSSLITAGTVTLPACKAIVACSLDLTPETFSRELHQFEKDGLLAVDRRSIQIFDIPELQRFAF